MWQNIVSPHLSSVARALASIPGQSVTVVAEDELPERRTATGWRTPDCSPARVLISPTNAEVEQLIALAYRLPSVHLLSGLSAVALNQRVLRQLAPSGALVGLISESADNRGILGLARMAKYRVQRRQVEQDIDFILAMGELGVEWFERAGYDPARIFSFAYVTERPLMTQEKNSDAEEHGPFRILYLGRILRLKDGVTAIRALQRLSASDWQFDLVGDGPDLRRWKKAAAESGVADRIHFRPTVDNGEVGDLLQHADLLLLPSRKDGWGAVVNEALMSGVPVICSDNCGAGVLLRDSWRGSIFQAGSVGGLRRALQRWIEGGRRTVKSSGRIREWSAAVEGPQVAQYLVAIVRYLREAGPRPSPPWY